METMAHLVYPVYLDATAPRETEEETDLLVFLVSRVHLVFQEFLELRETLVV